MAAMVTGDGPRRRPINTCKKFHPRGQSTILAKQNRSAAEACSQDEPISARATNPPRVRRAKINWRCPLAFRDAGRQRGLMVPSNFAGECSRLIAPTPDDAALMILRRYCA
jgi:hypothetical protein